MDTKDWEKCLIGQGPLVVVDDGRVLEGGSAETAYDVLCRYRVLVSPEFDVEIEWLEESPLKTIGARTSSLVDVSATNSPSDIVYSAWLTRTTKGNTWDITIRVPSGDDERLRSGRQIVLIKDGARIANVILGKAKHTPI